ncbi:caspase-8 isoform X1 [Glossina fuscipes]|uniref:Caspase-8 isoform X1 n=1 Tax=Glossina fuscipes TaxID=7396 RepID=A0A8U0WLU9_9MUSC|nr:caspase-8 isoform X1 [Glossina fuscipes]
MKMLSQSADNHFSQMKQIDVEDLRYIERDLSYYQLVSLGFLLFGEEKTSAEYILQKLIVLSKHPPSGCGQATQNGGDMILRLYANSKRNNWREGLLEALTIINAKRVLRKLGFRWKDLHHHYLPQIAELSINIHPMLKALYKICEELTAAQARRLISRIQTDSRKNGEECLDFRNALYLEIFLLDWITRRVIRIGDRQCTGTDVHVLIEYFKLNDMDSLKDLLNNTVTQNAEEVELQNKYFSPPAADSAETSLVDEQENVFKYLNDNLLVGQEDDDSTFYKIRRESAGFVVIINQNEFHQETDPRWTHLLPKRPFPTCRKGTDVDRDRLTKLFESLGYIPKVYDNLSHLEMVYRIRETVKSSIIYDSLIVFILTHGANGVVYGSNSIPVKISELQKIFCEESFKNKPKILIIQACQKDQPRIDEIISSDASKKDPLSYADMLVALAAIPGTEALRDTQKGSWYIQTLCDIIEKGDKKKHIFDILTAVAKTLTKKNQKQGGDDVMLPLLNSTLLKAFYLPAPI